MRGKLVILLLLFGVVSLVAYLGMHVEATPFPEQVLVLRPNGSACSGTISDVLKEDAGVLGIASFKDKGEFHVGISQATTVEAVSKRLADAAMPAAVVGTMSPVEYRNRYGRYFQTGTFVTCNGGCRR